MPVKISLSQWIHQHRISEVLMDNGSNLVSHPDHYYEDGNIILICQSVKFRLHRSILAAQSEVMKDMFAIPQTPQVAHRHQPELFNQIQIQTTIDGVPAVHMSDTMQSFAILLDMILLKKTISSHTLAEIIQVLDPVEKYCFDSLWGFLKQHMVSVYARHLLTPDISNANDAKEVARAIPIARRLGIPDILPLNFYALAIFCTQPQKVREVAEVLSILSPDDQARLLIGVARLPIEAILLIDDRVPALRLFSGPKCVMTHLGLDCGGLEPLEENEKEEYQRSPLSYWKEDQSDVYENRSHSCNPCLKTLRDGLTRSAENLKSALPEIFQI